MTAMISQDLNNAINAQIGREFGASMQYLQIASYFDGLALEKTAKLFFAQAQEEHDHAMKFIRYILDAGGEVHIPPIERRSPASPPRKKPLRSLSSGRWMLPGISTT